MTGICAGSQVGPYQVDNLIARGGMGEVYRARDRRLNRSVALKVLAPRYSADADRLERFSQEARTTALLHHPNIVAVYDIGSHAGMPFVVSELLDGCTLRARLRAGALPCGTAAAYGLEIARGLAAAHDLGVVHRDVKPENIFITNDERVKILDFGLATCRGETPVSGALDSGVFATPGIMVGTVGYAAPEQVRGLVADHRSDIFGLGVVLYEMIAGSAPFRRESDIETMHATLKEEAIALRKHDQHVPALFDHIVRHCLEKSREARFQSARDLAFSLELVQRALSDGDRARAQRSRNRFATMLRLF